MTVLLPDPQVRRSMGMEKGERVSHKNEHNPEMLAAVDAKTTLTSARAVCSLLFADGASPQDISLSSSHVVTLGEAIAVDAYSHAASETPFALPLRFDTVAAELDVLALTCALNFGSGFRLLLTRAGFDRGAFDVVRFGVMSMYIAEGGSGRNMSAAGLKDMSLSEVAALFDIPISKEVQHPTMQFVTISEHTELRPFAESIKRVLNEIGQVLERSGFSSFGAFLVSVCKPAPLTADELVVSLAKAFPCFNDVGTVSGTEVHLHMKAQRLAFHMHQKFPQLVSLPAAPNTGSDPAVVAALVARGVIVLPTAVAAAIDAGKPLDAEVEACVRAAGVAGVEAVVAACQGSVKDATPMGMSMYLRGLEKGAKRFTNMATVLF
ncbi:hypothetical protein BC830DRAFT_1224285 [Chytriomyces sp. MP71]|nr:hypothetical protein BC830DRAFT_1224285 [Chytriomyces sp. MP71]